jgi:uncharacterized protein (TIRG00374 family)
VKLDEVFEIIARIHKKDLFFLLAITFTMLAIKAKRFQILLHKTDTSISYLSTLKVFIATSAITPLPGGEASRAVFLKKEVGALPKDTAGAIITQAGLEMFSASCIALIASMFVHKMFIPTLIIFTVILITSAIVIHKKTLMHLGSILKKWKKTKEGHNKLVEVQKDIHQIVKTEGKSKLPSKTIITALLLALFAHICGGFLFWNITKALTINLSFIDAVFVFTSSLVISGLSTVIPGGLGVTEGSMTGTLLLLGIPSYQSFAAVILFRALTLLFPILLGLLFLLIFYSKSLFLPHKRGAAL